MKSNKCSIEMLVVYYFSDKILRGEMGVINQSMSAK